MNNPSEARARGPVGPDEAEEAAEVKKLREDGRFAIFMVRSNTRLIGEIPDAEIDAWIWENTGHPAFAPAIPPAEDFGTWKPANEPAEPHYLRWRGAGFGPALVPVIPPGVPLRLALPGQEAIPAEEREYEVVADEAKCGRFWGKVPGGLWSGGEAWYPAARWQEKKYPATTQVRTAKAGGNLGIRTGLYPAVDIDVHLDGDRALADAIEQTVAETLGASPVRHRANSPSRALLFRWEGTAPLSKVVVQFTTPAGDSDALVEVLGDGQQLVVAGMHKSGAPLEWRPAEPVAADLPALDAAKLETLLSAVEASLLRAGCTDIRRSGKRGEKAAKVAAPVPFNRAQVEGALASIPQETEPLSYDEWFRVGCGLHHTDPDPAGECFALWLAFSKRAPTYKPGECEAKWASMKRGEGGNVARLASVFAIARARDWRESAALASEFIYVLEQDRYVRLRDEGVVYLPGEGGHDRQGEIDGAGPQILATRAVNALLEPESLRGMFVIPAPITGKPKAVEPSKWLNGVCRKVDNLVWYPGRPAITEWLGSVCVNVFRQPPVIEAWAHPALWLSHMEYLLPVKEEREHALNILALNVQALDRKAYHALVIVGPQGVGKDMALHPVRLWMNKHGQAWRDEQMDVLVGGFQYHLWKAKFLCIQESRQVHYDAAFALYNQLKNVIAPPPTELSVNLKNTHPFSIPNLAQVIILTNYGNGVFFDDKMDRRYFVTQAAGEAREPAYYATLGMWIEAGGWRDVIGWLQARDLSGFRPEAPAPDTAARQAMYADTRAAGAQQLLRRLEEFDGDIITPAGIATLGEHGSPQLRAFAENNHAVRKLMIEAGWKLHNLDFKGMKEAQGARRIPVYGRNEARDESVARGEVRKLLAAGGGGGFPRLP